MWLHESFMWQNNPAPVCKLVLVRSTSPLAHRGRTTRQAVVGARLTLLSKQNTRTHIWFMPTDTC